MPKRIALKDHVAVDSVDLSNFARSRGVHAASTSGSTSAGSTPPAPTSTSPARPNSPSPSSSSGPTAPARSTRRCTRSTRDREVVAFAVAPRPDRGGVARPTRSCTGNVQILTYSPAATRGEADTFEVEFSAADEDGLVFVDTVAA